MSTKGKDELAVSLESYKELLGLATMLLDTCLALGMNYKKHQADIAKANSLVKSLEAKPKEPVVSKEEE